MNRYAVVFMVAIAVGGGVSCSARAHSPFFSYFGEITEAQHEILELLRTICDHTGAPCPDGKHMGEAR